MDTILLGAGPMRLHPEVADALAAPMLHHTSLAFNRIYSETVELLQRIYRTRNMVLIFPGSGTGANEAIAVNTFSPGDKVIICNGGFYGERFRLICEAYKLNIVNLKIPHGDPTLPETVEEALKAHPDAKGVVIIHVETTTGAVSPIREISAAVRKIIPGALVIVDAVASLGGVEIKTDEWDLDLVSSAPQKALMGAPGLSLVSVSDRAWARVETSTMPRYFFDFKRNREAAAKLHAVTPAVSLVVALHKALSLLLSEDLEAIYARHIGYRDFVLGRLRAEGFRQMAKPGYEAPTVSAAFCPSGVSAIQVVDGMEEKRGVKICTGLGQDLDKYIRIGHMGYVSMSDLERAVTALVAEIESMKR
ncbi:MAG: alanine--glyoxylate aminotransferase family protein [Planctomycetota bacterium]|jgi:aspartate aminotransferase-like enzyme|nr:alanine--glyoxylate aminotransferase family protein [Planctomycetota bacterium]